MGQRAPDSEHDQRAHGVGLGTGQHAGPGGRIQQIEADHRHVELTVVSSAGQHRVCRVVSEALGDAEEADLAGGARALQSRQQRLDTVVVLRGQNAVQVEHIDAVGAQAPQAGIQTFDQSVGCHSIVAPARARLGGQDHPVAPALQRFTHDILGAVDAGRVDEVDAEIQRGVDDASGARRIAAGREAEPAVATAAKTDPADPKPRASQRDVVHRVPPCTPIVRFHPVPEQGERIRSIAAGR